MVDEQGGDRPAIELTLDAVRAGADEIERFDHRFEGTDEEAVMVFCAMARRLNLTVGLDGLSELLQSASQLESQSP
jgi:hypothetical protein